MKKMFVGAILLFLPTKLARLLLFFCKTVDIAPSARVGFSLILADTIVMSPGSRVGHLNYMKCRNLQMDKDSRIKNINILKGIYDIEMAEKSAINRSNTIVNSLYIPSLMKAFSVPTLKIGYNSVVGVKHFIDMTANVTIGENSILAGRSSELWTHAFYHKHTGSGRYMIRGRIIIGNNCYIGSHVIFNCGVSVADTATVAAGAIVSKDIAMGGVFCAQPLRHIDFDPDEAVRKYKSIDGYHYEKE